MGPGSAEVSLTRPLVASTIVPTGTTVGVLANRTNPRRDPGTRIITLPLIGVRTTVFANVGTGASTRARAPEHAVPVTHITATAQMIRSSSLSHVRSPRAR